MRTSDSIKNKLISLQLVSDNNFLQLYCELVSHNFFTEKQKYITQTHHIIPKCYYKQYELPIDNNSNNIVYLSAKDHMLAHYYLYKCSLQDWFKLANLQAILYCKKNLPLNMEITQDWIAINLESSSQLLEAYNKLKEKETYELHNSKSKKQHKIVSNETREKISISKTNPSELVRKHLKEAHIGKKQTVETIQKRSESLKLAHMTDTKYKDVGKKISLAKKSNNSGNNRKDKIHIINKDLNKHKYVLKKDLDSFLAEGYSIVTKKSIKNRRKVCCLETNQVFNSIKEANLWAKTSRVGVCCRSQDPWKYTAGGYHWAFI